MSQQQISKLWTVVRIVLLYYTLNSWLVSQGGNEIFGIKLVHSSRVPAAMLAILIGTVLLTTTSLIGRLYAGRASMAWHERIPVVGFESITTGSPEGRIYQAAMLILLSLLPCLSLIYFWLVFVGGKVVTTGSNARIASGIWDLSVLGGADNPARICENLKASVPAACENGATFFPVVEPLILALLTGLAVFFMLIHWRSVFRKDMSE